MAVKESSADRFSKLFRHYHDALSVDFQCSAGTVSDNSHNTPEAERDRLFTAVRLALIEVVSSIEEKDDDRRRFFAKPGEAEWGC
jgi:hypothetical protein